MIVLGLDISTNCSGFSIIDDQYQLIDQGYIDTSKQDDYISKFERFINELEIAVRNYDVTDIAIEDIMSKFTVGKSSAKTIISLARFNGMASYYLYSHLRITPIHMNVLRARNLAGIKIPKGINTKEYVLSKVREWYPDMKVPMMKKKDKVADSAYDIADSVVVSRAYLKLVENEKDSKDS